MTRPQAKATVGNRVQGALQNRPLLLRLALVGLLGWLGAFSLPPFDIWPLFLVALMGAGLVLQSASSVRQAAVIGWAFGTGYFCGAWPWIMEPFQVDAAETGWMAPFALVFLSAGIALFWAVAFGLAQRIGGTGRYRLWALIVTLPLSELGRAYLFTGFPWAQPAQIWIDHHPAQLLAWLGPHGLTLLTVLAAILPIATVGRWRIAGALLIVPLMFLIGWTAPALRPGVELTGQTIRLVQPNAPQHEKWDRAKIPMFFKRQLEFTAAGETRPDMIVWPETAVPGLLNYMGPDIAVMAQAAQGADLIFGIQREENGQYFNSLVHVAGNGQVAQVYDKHHLVPFGEYMPFAPLARHLGIRAIAERADGGYSAGPGPSVLPTPIGGVLPLICYEAVFPQDARAATHPDLMIQITNDAWFGERIGPYQHLAQARMRALEQGVPLARSANTGVSALIDPKGRILAQLPLGEAGYVDADLPGALPAPLYARSGDLPWLFLMVFVLGALLWRKNRRLQVLKD